jgi:hypothetical protein
MFPTSRWFADKPNSALAFGHLTAVTFRLEALAEALRHDAKIGHLLIDTGDDPVSVRRELFEAAAAELLINRKDGEIQRLRFDLQSFTRRLLAITAPAGQA